MLMSKRITSQSVKQTIAINILPNISKNIKHQGRLKVLQKFYYSKRFE